MFLISHRGNISGKLPERENTVDYIQEALELGYDVEVDVWKTGNELYLGHDGPENLIELEFLRNDKLWCHAKNVDSLVTMMNRGIHCFWHQTDDVTLTSRGYLWTYPGKPLAENSICVMPELSEQPMENSVGVCSDFIDNYRNKK